MPVLRQAGCWGLDFSNCLKKSRNSTYSTKFHLRCTSLYLEAKNSADLKLRQNVSSRPVSRVDSGPFFPNFAKLAPVLPYGKLIPVRMSTARQIKTEQRVSGQQKGLVGELQALVKDLERAEKTVNSLKSELGSVAERHANRTTTQHEIAYLEDILACFRKKLVWEKQIASLQKRTPELMQRVEALVNHPQSNPDQETQDALMTSIKEVQAAMNRLNESKL